MPSRLTRYSLESATLPLNAIICQCTRGFHRKRRKSKVKINFVVLAVVVVPVLFRGAPYKVPGYPVVVFGAHFSSLCGASTPPPPSSTPRSPLVLLLVSFNVSFICFLVPRHEKGLEEWMEPGLLGIALYLGPLFSLFDACLLISGCRLHCVSSGGHCLPRLVGPLSSVACKDCNTL